jgi:ABC-2 type transport system permease protein
MMKVIFKLFLYNLKMFFRDKQAFFWTIFFPVMFVTLFGLFDFERMGTSNIAIIDQSGSDQSAEFIDGLKEIETLKIQQEEENVERAKESLEKGDLDFVLVIPEGFGRPLAPSVTGDSEIRVEVYYDEANAQLNPLVLGFLDQFVAYANLQAAGAPTLFSLDKKPVKARNIGYLEFLVPGVLAMGLMTSGVMGMASDIAEQREKKILKRLFVTPLKPSVFLVAQVGVFLVITILQISIILAVAVWGFGLHVFGSYPLIYLIGLLGSILFLTIGFIVAGVVKSTKAVHAIAQLVTMPMMFLSGVFFSKEIMPAFLAAIADYLPLTPLIDSLRKALVEGAGITDLGSELLRMGAWFVVLGILATKTLRFREE